MKIFLSWSGERSKAVADALKDWLGYLLQGVDAWMSEKDISPGVNWNRQLSSELEKSSFGVICLTRDNLTAPWLLFEAGALSKAVESSRVVPYCFDLEPLEVQGPLAQFQGVKADKHGTLRLVRSINELLESRLPEDRLDTIFERWWPDLAKAFEQIPKALPQQGLHVVNLERVYCAYTEEFGPLGADKDLAVLTSSFDESRVVRRPNVRKLQLEEDLSTGRFEIIHLLGTTDPERGDLFFGGAGEKVKCEGLIRLISNSGARLVFLATCNSTVLAARLSRTTTVVAAYGDVDTPPMVTWEQTFYNLLAKGRSITEAFDIAQASSDIPMTLHLKADAVFVVPR